MPADRPPAASPPTAPASPPPPPPPTVGAATRHLLSALAADPDLSQVNADQSATCVPTRPALSFSAPRADP